MLQEQSTWRGPYLLNMQAVEKLIGDGPGMYALGEPKPGNKFEMTYIGSSVDLKGRLKSFLGKYRMFMFDAFEVQTGVFADNHVPAESEKKVNKVSDRD